LVDITLTMNTEHIVTNELAKEGPQDVVLVRRENSLITTEEFVGDCTSVGSSDGFTNAISKPDAFGTTAQIAVGRTPIGIEQVVAFAVHLTNKVAS